MSFTGFTESQISTGKSKEKPPKQISKPLNKTKQPVRQQYRTSVSSQEESLPIPNEAKLSLPVITKSGNPDILRNLDETGNRMLDTKPNETLDESNDKINANELKKENDKSDVNTKVEDQVEVNNGVESVIEKQKLIEEENKRKKAAIKKALEDRKTKTTQESQKLQHVQTELLKIDQIVAGDVNLLRKTIEDSSYTYMEAQKRYERAEKEFISAKEALFVKSERKDQLTAHLASIIQLNEERKSKKLTELMEELDIPDT